MRTARKGQSGSWDTIKVTKAKKDGGLILGDGDEDKKIKWVDWESVWEFKSTGFVEQSDTDTDCWFNNRCNPLPVLCTQYVPPEYLPLAGEQRGRHTELEASSQCPWEGQHA